MAVKPRGAAPKGTILMMVLVFTIILSMIGLAVIYIFGMEEIASRSEIVSARVLYLSDAGIEMTKAWMINKQKFPELTHSPADHNPFVPYQSAAGDMFPQAVNYPDGVVGTISVYVAPYPSNNVNTATQTGVDGHYTVVSSGTITIGTNPGNILTVTKNVSSTIYISSRAWDAVNQSSFTYRTVSNSWYEKPVQRVYH